MYAGRGPTSLFRSLAVSSVTEKALYCRNQSLLANCLHFVCYQPMCLMLKFKEAAEETALASPRYNSEDGGKKEQEQRGSERESNLPPPSPSVSQAQARRRTISPSSLPASQEPAPCFPSPSPPLLLVRSSSRDAFSETQHRLRNSSARLS